jgi:GDPmannose 4,6-dehydratase
MFGLPKKFPQTEESLLHPRSPYGVSKVAAHHLVVNYRESFGQFASTGILFNHESPRRGETFVTRKITRAIGEILNGSKEKLYLGNLNSVRDWGFAKEYVESMWLMLQQTDSSDYVIATGKGATVKDFAQAAFESAGLDWEQHVVVKDKYKRPTEVDALIGDTSKAKEILGWEAKTTWKELAVLMTKADVLLAKAQ